MGSCPTPTGIADLSADWLSCALGRPVADVGMTPIGTGQVADSVRLTIEYVDGPPEPATLVAKVPSGDEASRRAARLTRTYEKEAGFFTDLAAGVPVRTPHCSWAGFDAATDAYAVVLEDLAPGVPGDQVLGCTPAQAAAAVDEVALLHGAMWGAPGLDRFAWLGGASAAAARPAAGSFLERLLPPFLERYERRLSPDVVELAQRAVPRLSRSAPVGGPRTIVHGDFRNDNLMFGHPDGRVCVLDWQTVAVNHGVSDLSYFLGGSLLTDVRRGHEEELVGRYRAGLARQGISLTADECWRGYRRFAFGGLTMAVIAAMLVERTDRGDDMFLAMAERAGRHALDLDAEELL